MRAVLAGPFNGRWTRPRRALLAASVASVAALAAPAVAFSPGQEARNFAKIEERQRFVTSDPEFQAMLQRRQVEDTRELARIRTEDPERDFSGNICASRRQECAGEVRFYDWDRAGHGLMRPVLFLGRSGAVISGNVWATRRGPERRPAVVITTGSVQAPETLYWGIAANLAKRGYVVLTYDVQGQGRSDTFGEGPDRQEGVPSQAGQPFYDGTEDALDFLLSSRRRPYDPRPSCGNANDGVATDHSPKHARRVREGFNAPYNPLYHLVDHARVGIAGHSLGAGAVSFVGQKDRRVDALVGWDNLSEPESSFGVPECPARPGTRSAPPITKPALGMSNDYGLVPTPYTSDPDPQRENEGFLAYRDAGVDAMQVNIRGGTHYEYSFIPGSTLPYPLGTATLRGMDMATWYTAAWLDKYVKCQGLRPRCERRADRLLLTDRWRRDARGARVDPGGDGNLFSFYLRSRYDLERAGGAPVRCAHMRAGCAQMRPDPRPPGFSYVATGLTDDWCAERRAGTSGADRFAGTAAGEEYRARGGADRIGGAGGHDCLYAGGGRDRAGGGPLADELRGGRGPDRLDGGAGADRLLAGAGADRVLARDRASDLVRCGRGRDLALLDRRDRSRGCERVRRS